MTHALHHTTVYLFKEWKSKQIMEARVESEDPRIKMLKENIQPYPDFPKQGIVFQDIFGAMRKAPVLKVLMELIQEDARKNRGKVDCVVGLDARGFLFGPIMALELEVPFVPVSFEIARASCI